MLMGECGGKVAAGGGAGGRRVERARDVCEPRVKRVRKKKCSLINWDRNLVLETDDIAGSNF